MSKPVLLCVDDDPQVLRAVARDLRRQFQGDYRIVSAASGAEALDATIELKNRGENIALFLVDQRMPAMTGVEFLTQARPLFPDARRVLLTAYADTSAAIDAINSVRLNHYLLKAVGASEENLFPILRDELADWRANTPPEFSGIKVIGTRFNADSHRVKDFLARNSFPYMWMDVESEIEACQIYMGGGKPPLPLVILENDERLENPSTEFLAEKLGLQTRATGEFYDFVVVGAGPAGLAAAVYAASEG
jgi:thioredoxin reductase (NADPH)